MAFMRAYAREHQGDPSPIMRRSVPRLRSMRAGRLIHANQGDPFKFGKFFKRITKPPKALRKLTIGKALGGLAKVASFAAPMIPGFGGIAASALAGLAGGGPGRATEAPELMEQQPVGSTPIQTPFGVFPQLHVPGIEVSARRSRRAPGRRNDLEELLRQLLAMQEEELEEPDEEVYELPDAEYDEFASEEDE